MANVSMAWPNIIDATTVSGGSWMASLPVTNVQNRRISKVARSNNSAPASTLLNIDIGPTPQSIGMLALVVHNLSVMAKVRIRADDAPDFATPIHDSGWISAYPSGVIPQGLVEWGDDNFWLGTLSQNAIAGYRAPYTYYTPTPINMRYWRIEIDDATNPDGWVQIGRLFMGKVWAPAYNMKYGAKIGYSDATASETSLTGEEFFDVRTRFREYDFELGYLSKEEALSVILNMQQQLGISGEVLISGDRSDVTNTPRLCFLGRMKSISPVAIPNFNIWQTSFEIKEIL